MFTTAADPTVAFVDGVKVALLANAVLVGLVTGIYGHLSEAARVAYPYIVLGRRTTHGDGESFGITGGRLSLQIDIFSAAKGPYQVSAIGAEVHRALDRQPITVPGFVVIAGSLTREFQEVFDEPDADKPEAILYHAVQQWSAQLEAA
jgi:hypothetical protein